MQVYKYNEKTKEYINTEPALLDPLETEQQGKVVYILPANATFSEPTVKAGYASVWNGTQWTLVEDNRGVKYWLVDDTYDTPAQEMKELGALPAEAITERPAKTLDVLKSEKIVLLKAQRDSAEVMPIEYNGNTFDYDDKARDRINAAIIALDVQGEGASIDWTTADNKNVTVTATDLRNAIAMVAVRSNLLHSAYRIAKEKVEAATTAEEVEAITLQ